MRRYTPARFTDVKLTGAFWRERLDTVLARTVPSQHRQLAAHGILESLKLPKPVPPVSIPPNRHNFTTQIFWDSDVGKWIEVASYALAHKRDAEIEAQIDAVVEDLAKAQLPDGYLNCWYIQRELENRWTNLRDNHELYNAGHLLEGAIAYYQATGRRRFLDIMERYLDHIAETFGTGPGQKRGYPGHPEIELALVKLYHLTGDKRRLDLAAYFVNERGAKPNYFDIEAEARGDDHYWAGTHEYSQSHKPVREQDKAVGHAVRAMYLYTAMADLAAELDDAALKRACERLWEDITTKRMYVTAGVGPSAHNEGFTKDYDLPNDTAYAETCASVALILWAQRMLNLDLEGKYADTLELALFNGALTGLSRDGEHYFYDNPLESDGSHTRWAWHPCPCCTMNASRLIASVSGYFYATSADSLIVHLYGGTETTLDVAGTRVGVMEESDYPWSGAVSITLTPEAETEFGLKLRIPGWARGARAKVNGEEIDVAANTVNGYLGIRRRWAKGDRVELDLPMRPERVYANPQVSADFGRVALRRGPLVYCLEQADNPGIPVRQTRLPRNSEVRALARNDLFDGATLLTAEGKAIDDDGWQRALYRTEPPRERPATLTAIPYFLWNNRGPGPMQVWIAEEV
ncbi:glycoside hydrolase family 127 protein [Chelativorans salis]|uniref:Glycoside hydrolase family 127 protein n=1 Tax=Chelativorans salis TaxID=2978478 RepID=A0ABT2LT01_9HYPH|nr:beta-L-arabinofuranosidase domain-containing protein [Chelativorans sp. EGI FJ00035]MCT7377645.1 glycoside hydrolase family 127 protein [Chelativorans sp. EGI FJ00035]